MPDLTEQLRALVAKWRAKSDADYPSRDEATGMAPEIRYDAEGRCEQLDECTDELSALLAAAEGVERDDFVRVPREPTEAMMKAADRAVNESTYEVYPEEVRAAWDAMLEAAAMRDSGGGRE